MKKLLLAAVAVVAASPSVASDYLCQVRETGDGRGFVSPVVEIELQPENKRAFVMDRLIDEVKGKPIRAKLRDRGDGKYRIMYRVNNIPATPSYADITYRIDLDTVNKTIAVRGSLAASTNTTTGRGRCDLGTLPQG